MATVTTAEIQEIYIGYLGRAADQAGLDYWVEQITNDALTLEQLRANITNEQQEYIDGYGQLTRAELVEAVYQSLFNRSPDAEGLAYWVDGEGADVNADQLILAITNGAQTADQAILDNKVAVSEYYAAQAGDNYNQDAAADAIANVDGTEASVTAANAAIDTLVEQLELNANLDAVNDAQTALDDFLAAADGDDDATTFTTGILLGNAEVTAESDVATEVGAGYVGASDALKAAMIEAQETVNAAALATAEADVAAAEAAIDAVEGLTAAIMAAEDARAAEDAATDAAAATQVAADATEAAWVVTAEAGDVDTATAITDNASGELTGELTVAVNGTGLAFADDTVLTLTEVDADTGLATLADADASWTAEQVAFFEAQQALVAELVEAFNADVAADAAVDAAVEASDAADLAAALLDAGSLSTTTTALANVGAGFTETTVADATVPTAAEIAAEIAALGAIEEAGLVQLASDLALVAWDTDKANTVAAFDAIVDQAETDGFIDADSVTAIKSAFATPLTAEADLADAMDAAVAAVNASANTTGALATFEALVQAYYTEELADSPLAGALPTLDAAVDTAQDAIDALADAIAAETEASDLVDQFNELDGALTAAQDVLTDADYVVADIAATQAGTVNNDVYMLDGVSGTITGFGAEGSDSIFLGDDYALNTGDILTDGDNSALEIFLTEDAGGNTTVTIETSAFGSNASTPEVVEIVLQGVGADELTLSNGLLTIA